MGSRLTLVANISEALRLTILNQILALLEQLKELQQKLSELIAGQKLEQTKPVATTATTTDVVKKEEAQPEEKKEVAAPAPAGPLVSDLRIEVTYPSMTLSTYGEKLLTEFRLIASEKIAITRIRFKNDPLNPLADAYLRTFKLVNSVTNEILVIVDSPVNRVIEFKLVADEKKSDKGLMVSGKTYHVLGTIITPQYGAEKPKIRLDIESVSDIAVFDYSDLSRAADISKFNTFPIIGPTISTF